jgi:hypothetical protein
MMTGLTGTAFIAVFVKMFPYMVAAKVIGGAVDIAVHAVKHKISKSG